MNLPPHLPELSPQALLRAYCNGCFPMAAGRRSRTVRWYSPDPRAILPLDEVRFSRSLMKRYRRGDYVLTHNRAFERVIRACAEPRPSTRETWINDAIIRAYTDLHQHGFAHSIEAWRPCDEHGDMQLVGGLYGVAIGRAFCGESMFSIATDASKVCLVRLIDWLREQGCTLLDVQFNNDHMAQFGVVEIPREEYLKRLAEALSGAQND